MFPRAVCSRRFFIGCFALRSVHFVPSWSAKAPAPYSSRWRWFLLTPTRRGLQKHTHNPTSYRYKISQSACGVFLFRGSGISRPNRYQPKSGYATRGLRVPLFAFCAALRSLRSRRGARKALRGFLSGLYSGVKSLHFLSFKIG